MAGRLGTLTLDLIAKIGGFTGPMEKAKKQSKDFSDTLAVNFASISAAWLKVGAIIAASAWFTQAAKKSLEAEVAFNKLSITIDNMGLSYKALTPEIEKALAKTKDYAIVQDEDIAAVLQQLILHTGNYKKSLDSLNIVYDLAYLKNIDAGEAATIYGKAIAGNIEGLGRLFPELKNVDELLGKYATTADKAAYAQAFFTEKVSGASDKMTDHEKAVKRVSSAYEDLHQTIGKVLIDFADSTLAWYKQDIAFQSILDKGADFNTAVVNIYNAMRYGTKTAQEMALANMDLSGVLMDETKAIALVGSAHERTAEQIATAAKKESDAVESQLERIKKMTVPQGGGSLQAFILGDLDMAAVESIGLELGSKFFDSFNAASKLEIATPEIATDDLDYSSKYITRLQFDAAYNEAYFALLDERFNIEANYENDLLDAHLAQAEAMDAIDKERLLTASKVAGGTVDFANNMYTILGQKGKAFAQVAKGLAITQAVIDGKTAAVAAWAAGMKAQPQGWWSPIVAAGFTAASLAQTGALIASIGGSQGGGGGGLGGGGTVTTAPGGGFNSEYPSPTAIEARPIQSINIIIHTLTGQIDGKAQEEIVRAINEAGDRDVRINATAIAGAY